MKAIILAAGEGVRMRPLTLTIPKPLLKVASQPLLYHLVSKFPPEIDELIIVIGYLGEQIQNYCGNEFLGRPVSYVWQKEKRGTYDALALCQPLLKRKECFFLFYADDLIDAESIKNCLKYELAATAKIMPESELRRFGIVNIDENGFIKEIEEKPENPRSNLALASCYLLNTDIFKYPPAVNVKSGEYYLVDAIAQMAKDYKIAVVPIDFWFPIATPEDIQKAEEIIIKKYH